MLEFSHAEIEGFRSIVEPQVFQLNRGGLNMVKGTNGAGKSTVFESLVWCLFGSNLKGTVSAKVQSWKEIRPKNYKGTKVTTYFNIDEDQYGICRTVKHADHGDALIVEKNGIPISELDKKDSQAYIDNLLGMDFNVFMNSFMFGQKMTRMVQSTSADKRKLFEDMFDMDWIGVMKDKAANDKGILEIELATAETVLTQINMSYTLYADELDEAKQRRDATKAELYRLKREFEERENKVKDEIADLTAEKGELLQEIANLPDKIEVEKPIPDAKMEADYSTLGEEIEHRKRKYDEVSMELRSLNRDLENYDDSDYQQYLQAVSAAENRMVAIVAELFGDEATDLLTDEEIADFETDYADAVEKVSAIHAKRDVSIKTIRDLKANSYCPACNRPFDNAEELEKHKQEEQEKLDKTKAELESANIQLKVARDELNLVEEYKKHQDVITLRKQHAPPDPEEAKQKLLRQMTELDKKVEKEAGLLEELLEKRYKMDEEFAEYDKAVEEFEDAYKHNQSIENKKRDLEYKVQSIDFEIKSIRDGLHPPEMGLLDNIDDEVNRVVAKMKKTKKNIQEAELKVNSIKNSLTVAEFWLKNVFAANGLRAYIFKAMLDELNQYTEKYGSKLGCSMRFSLDLTKTSAPFSTICTLGDKINKDYKEFSGGEQQRLDIVMMFAMHDLLSSTSGMNLLIMDEVFEGLDEQGESDVFELIREKADGRSVYVISHSQVLDTLHSKTINIENHNGKTILPC